MISSAPWDVVLFLVAAIVGAGLGFWVGYTEGDRGGQQKEHKTVVDYLDLKQHWTATRALQTKAYEDFRRRSTQKERRP